MAERKVSIVISAQDMASNVLGQVEARLKGMTANIVSGLAIYNAAAAGVRAFYGAMAEGVQAAAESERVTAQLQRAMLSVGEARRSATDRLTQYAGALSQTSVYEDDAIAGAMQLLITIGRLRGEGLERATQATLDLAAATGKDLNEAAMAVAKGAAGSTVALGKLGIATKDAAGNAASFSDVLDQIQAKMGGAAEAEAGTLYGSVSNLKKAFGELGEEIGRQLIQRLTGNDMQTAIDNVNALTEAMAGKRNKAASPEAVFETLGAATESTWATNDVLRNKVADWKATLTEAKLLVLDIYDAGDKAGKSAEEIFARINRAITDVDTGAVRDSNLAMDALHTLFNEFENLGNKRQALGAAKAAAGDLAEAAGKVKEASEKVESLDPDTWVFATAGLSRFANANVIRGAGVDQVPASKLDFPIADMNFMENYQDHLAKVTAEFAKQRAIVRDIAATFQGALASGIYVALNNTRSLGQGLKAIFESVLDTVKRIIAEMIASSIIKWALNTFGGGLGGFTGIMGGNGGIGPSESYSTFSAAMAAPAPVIGVQMIATGRVYRDFVRESNNFVKRRGGRVIASEVKR